LKGFRLGKRLLAFREIKCGGQLGRKRAVEAAGPDGAVDSLRSCDRRDEPTAPLETFGSHKVLGRASKLDTDGHAPTSSHSPFFLELEDGKGYPDPDDDHENGRLIVGRQPPAYSGEEYGAFRECFRARRPRGDHRPLGRRPGTLILPRRSEWCSVSFEAPGPPVSIWSTSRHTSPFSAVDRVVMIAISPTVGKLAHGKSKETGGATVGSSTDQSGTTKWNTASQAPQITGSVDARSKLSLSVRWSRDRSTLQRRRARSKAPMSTTATLSPSPSTTLGFPSISFGGRPLAPLSPASMLGEPACRR
jgi:hypothetical protein